MSKRLKKQLRRLEGLYKLLKDQRGWADPRVYDWAEEYDVILDNLPDEEGYKWCKQKGLNPAHGGEDLVNL